MFAYTIYVKKPGILKYAVVMIFFCFGLLSKPMLVTLPCVLLLMDFWPLDRVGYLQHYKADQHLNIYPILKLSLEKIPLLAMGLAAVFLSSYSLKLQGVYISTLQRPMSIRIENAIVTYVKYIFKTFWPADLAVFYPFPITIPLWKVISAAVVLAAVSVMVFRKFRAFPWLTVGWLWFLGTLFPVIGLVQGGLWPEMADRWAYVPQVGLFIMIAWTTARLIEFGKKPYQFLAMVTGAALIALSIGTWFQVKHWKNSKTLFNHAIAATGENFILLRNLGKAYFDEKDYHGAITQYRKALELAPNKAGVHFLLGEAYYKIHEPNNAISHYLATIKLAPEKHTPYTRLGSILNENRLIRETQLGYENRPVIIRNKNELDRKVKSTFEYERNVEAIEKEVLKVIETTEEKEAVYYNVGAFYGKQGKLANARKYLEKTIALNPINSEANFNLGIIAVKQNRPKSAEKHLIDAIESNSQHIDARNNLGHLFLMTGRIRNAIREFQAALKLDPMDTLVRTNLADALMKAGELDKAHREFSKIIEIDPENEDAQMSKNKIIRIITDLDSEIAHTEALLNNDENSPLLLETMGDLYFYRGKPQQAIDYYARLSSLYPDNLEALQKVAITYSCLGKFSEAIVYFKKGVELAPDIPENYYNVACMYSRLNEIDLALKWLRQALDKGYNKLEKLEYDEDLDNVRNTPRFQDTIGGY